MADENVKGTVVETPISVNLAKAEVQPAPDEWAVIRDWGTQQVKDQATRYAFGRAAEFIAETALGARAMLLMRWFLIAEWGALAVGAVLAVLSIMDIINQSSKLLGVLGLVLAGFAIGIWFLIRTVRRFIDRQIMKAFDKFQELLGKGLVQAEDWPLWYQKNKNKKKAA